MSKYALIVASTAYHADKFTWGQIRILQKKGYEVHIAASFNANTSGNSSKEYVERCRDNFIKNGILTHDIPFTRSPVSLNNLKSIIILKKIIKKYNYSVLHCHTPTGGLAARIAAAGRRKKGLTVLYTAHGFHFYKGAPIINWLLYYPAEWFLAKLTDYLITINEEDERAAKKMAGKKALRVNGAGVSRKQYEKILPYDPSDLGLPDGAFIFLYAGELSKRKNQGFLIRCFASVSTQCPSAFLLLAGEGSLKTEYKKLTELFNLTEKVIFLGWRDDMPRLVSAAQVVVSSAKQEGLPVNLIEAIMAGKPIIATPCRGNRELAEQAGIAAGSEIEFVKAMVLLYNRSDLRKSYGEAAKKASYKYDAKTVDGEMELIYGRI